MQKFASALQAFQMAMQKLALAFEAFQMAVQKLALAFEAFQIAMQKLALAFEAFQIAMQKLALAFEAHGKLVLKIPPSSFKGIIFLTAPANYQHDQGATFAPEFTALANALGRDFGGKAKITYTLPSSAQAAKITTPTGITYDTQKIETTPTSTLTTILDQIIAP